MGANVFSLRLVLLVAAAVICAPYVRAAIPYTFGSIAFPFTLSTLNLNFSYPEDAMWGDFDSDGFLDLAVTQQDNGTDVNAVYRNTRTGGVFAVAGSLMHGAGTLAKWGDYNNDNILDLLLGGFAKLPCSSSNAESTVLYEGDGAGGFTAKQNFGKYCYVSGAWGDFNADGWDDIVLVGTTSATSGSLDANLKATLWINNEGSGTFTSTPIAIQLPGGESDVCWGDYDSDGYVDLVVTGNDATGTPTTVLLQNDKGKGFNQVQTSFSGVSRGSCSWSDVDSDGFLDLLLTGRASNGASLTEIWRNHIGKSFEKLDTGLPDTQGTARWGDFNNDGLPDLCLMGDQSTGNSELKIYFNTANHTFMTNGALSLGTNKFGNCMWADFDNDGKLDLWARGQPAGTPALFQNTGAFVPIVQPPPVPANVTYFFYSDHLMHVFWERPANTEGTLTYNVWVPDVVSPLALSTGRRLVAQMGNAQTRTFLDVNGNFNTSLDYNVSVQTIDSAYRGSAFSKAVKTNPPDNSAALTVSAFGFLPSLISWLL